MIPDSTTVRKKEQVGGFNLARPMPAFGSALRRGKRAWIGARNVLDSVTGEARMVEAGYRGLFGLSSGSAVAIHAAIRLSFARFAIPLRITAAVFWMWSND